ncbi:MAG: hypothetical protein CUN57_00300, partial [Phototrophicales bacterium]
MEQLKSAQMKTVLQLGILSGIIVLYTGVVGMIAAFHEREVIDNFITLGQLVLMLTPFLMAFYTAKRLNDDGANIALVAGSGLLVGFLTAIPTIVILLFNDFNDVSKVFTNVNRDWIEVVTFDNRNDLMTGILTLAGISTAFGFIGSVFYILPEKIRRALIYGFSVTLIVGVFGETVRLVLQENLDRDTLGEIFRRDTLKQQPAIILFVLSTLVGFGWSFFGQRVRYEFHNMEGKQRTNAQLIGSVVLLGVLLI